MFFRVFKFAGQNFRRNIWLSLATTSIMTLTLISVNLLFALNVIGAKAIKMVEDRVDVIVYFKTDISDDIVLSARTFLMDRKAVKDVQFVGRDLALQKFRERHKDDPAILASLDEVGANPLGASLIVKASDPKEYEAILSSLDNPAYKDAILEKSFEDHRTLIEKLTSVTAKLKRSALALSLIFALIVMLIVVNSVRVAIYTRREEIGIMKLVGASDWFVRAPFLIEAAFAGVLAMFAAVAIVLPAVGALQPFLAKFFGSGAIDLAFYFRQNGLVIFGAQLSGAILLPMGIAGMAVGRYLKV
ncbi:ABC transporter permease [Candidatus Uhrbacteria bacterium]|nr:ABC transporter permease [Candidatus Uhrbacteria bacterium]